MTKVKISNHDVFYYMKPCYIQNTQRDNFYPITGQTRWTITAHDTTNKIITLSQPLPVELNEAATDWNNRWLAQGAPGNLVYITGVNFSTNQISYNYILGILSVSTNVSFMNPWRCWRIDPTTPLFTSNSWATTWVQPGTIWQHSDGTYRMIGVGYNGSQNRTGIYTSSDLSTWNNSGATYKYQAGVAPFNQSWCVGTVNHTIWGSSAKIRTGTYAQNYALAAFGLDSGGTGQAQIVIADENYNITHMPTSALTIPGYPVTGSSMQHVPIGTFYYHGNLYINISHRDFGTTPWTYISLLCKLDKWDDPTVTNVELVMTSPVPNSWGGLQYYVDGYFEHGGTLYAMAVGETQDTSVLDCPYWGNWELGLTYRNSGGTWTKSPQSPELINPISADGVWTGMYWASDSMGGGTFYQPTGTNTMYWFGVMKSGTDQYQACRRTLYLPRGRA